MAKHGSTGDPMVFHARSSCISKGGVARSSPAHRALGHISVHMATYPFPRRKLCASWRNPANVISASFPHFSIKLVLAAPARSLPFFPAAFLSQVQAWPTWIDCGRDSPGRNYHELPALHCDPRELDRTLS
jgi:hypothetical protein